MGLLNYTYSDVIKKIKKLDYKIMKQGKGSHEIWYNPDYGVSILIPNHGSKTLSKGVVSQIIHRLGMTNQEFKDL